MKFFGFVVVGIVGGTIGWLSRFGINEWQYWFIVAPICVYVGFVSYAAFAGR